MRGRARARSSAYAELVTKNPCAGGAALYTHLAFGRPLVTFLVGFAVMMSSITSASALANAFGGDYLSVFVELPTTVVALGSGVGDPGRAFEFKEGGSVPFLVL